MDFHIQAGLYGPVRQAEGSRTAKLSNIAGHLIPLLDTFIIR